MVKKKCEHQCGAAGPHSFDDDDLGGGFCRHVSGAVVFHSPASAGGEHQQRTGGEVPDSRMGEVDAQKNACGGDDSEREPHAFADRLVEEEQCDKRSCHRFEIEEQRGVGRGRPLQSPQEQEGRQYVEQNHQNDPGNLPARERSLPPVFPGEEGQKQHPQAGAKVEKRRQKHRRDSRQQQFGKRCAEAEEQCGCECQQCRGVFAGCGWFHL